MFRMNFVKSAIAGVVLLALPGCGAEDSNNANDVPDSREAMDASASAIAAAEEVTRSLFRLSPQSATSYGFSEEYMGGAFASKLDDHSPAAAALARQTAQDGLARLQAISRDGLNEQATLTLSVSMARLDNALSITVVDYGNVNPSGTYSPYVMTQLSGPHINIPNFLDSRHVINNDADASSYIGRLGAIEETLAGLEASVRRDAGKGFILPRFAIVRIVTMLDDFTAGPATGHPLYMGLKTKLAALSEYDGLPGETVLSMAEATIADSVYPAYRSLSRLMTSLLPRAQTHAGVWAQPDGEKLYAALVKAMGDTDMTPDEIHDLGLSEVARLQGEMDVILDAQGITEGTVGERMTALGEDPRYTFANTKEGRAELMAYLNGELSKINALLPQAFATLPPQPVVIRRIPEYAEASAPGGYYEDPPLDGSRPGTFFINLLDTSIWPRFDLPSLVHHESNPGHHFQISLALNVQDMPLSRRISFFNSYVEGWALYSELVAAELGVYGDDPIGKLGQLKSELYRAVRLVVDTGMHKKRWTRQQAIDYFHDNTGTHMTDVIIEIERYSVWPGQALGYKLGQLKFLELRARARTALGDDFDMRAFHDLVLLAGALPMTVLEARVDAWIATEQKH